MMINYIGHISMCEPVWLTTTDWSSVAEQPHCAVTLIDQICWWWLSSGTFCRWHCGYWL